MPQPRTIKTMCPMNCHPTLCGMKVTVAEGELLSIEGDTAEAVACRNVSDLEAVNSDGESIITDVRLDRSLQDFLLARDASAELGWYVVSDVSRNEPCDG